MDRNFLSALLMLTAAVILWSPAAQAGIVDLTYDGSWTASNAPGGFSAGTFTLTLSIDQNPKPDSVANGFEKDGIFAIITQGGISTPETGSVQFFDGGPPGGFVYTDFHTNTLFVDTVGPLLFTGPDTNPTLTLGTFTGFSFLGADSNSTLTISAATATPEPGTLALFGAGFAFLLLRCWPIMVFHASDNRPLC